MDEIGKNFFESYDSFEISLGELLRGERATLGKSYSDVQKDLKIKAHYISAIENCDLSGLDNKSFVAGYVRTYARYLGLDAEFVYERFCRESGFLSSQLNTFVPDKKKEIQKSNIAPANKNILNFSYFTEKEFEIKSSYLHLIKKLFPVFSLFLLLFGVSYWIMLIIFDIQRLEIIPIDQEPYSSVELQNNNEEIFELSNDNFDVQALNLENIAKNSLGNFYSTRDEIFPVVQNRDSPIVKIDPNSYGLFLKTKKMTNPDNISRDLIETKLSLIENKNLKTVVLGPTIPTLKLVAFEKSWIRLKDQNGDIYLERNLKKDEEFIIPSGLFSGSLRAGNATKVYFAINENLFGPLSTNSSVVKNFSIEPNNIKRKLSFVSNVENFLNLNSNNLNTASKTE